MEQGNRQKALERLLALAAAKGYVTFDDVFDCSSEFGLSFGAFDWLTENLSVRNIIIYDEDPGSVDLEDEDYGDYAQSDYEKLFCDIIEAEPSLESLINYIRNIKPPQWKETNNLKYQVKDGNTHARQRMIEMHMRHAVRIAWQRAKTYDADLETTIGDAFVGLITAVDKYEPDNIGAFASYASMWIRQMIGREQLVRNQQKYYPYHRREVYFGAYPYLKEKGCL